MHIRQYTTADCEDLINLFYNTVHTVNAKDYTIEQLNVWARKNMDIDEWNKSFEQHFSLVAVADGIIVGFGDIDDTGYLDRLYVHKDYQRRGVATALCDRLEKYSNNNTVTHASITAIPFFEHRGYTVIKVQQVERQGIMLTNFVMQKNK